MNTINNGQKTPNEHSRTLKEAIRAGDAHAAKAILKKITRAKQDSTASELAYLYADCVSQILSGANLSAQKKPEHLLFLDASGVCLYLELLVDELCEDGSDSGTDSGTGAEILSYVDQNIFRPELSLSMVAERFERQKSFVSALYKREKGINYVDYVNRIRVMRAAELLQNPETDLSLDAICAEVGYVSQSTFRRNFIKYIGCMPGRYRRSVQNGR